MVTSFSYLTNIVDFEGLYLWKYLAYRFKTHTIKFSSMSSISAVIYKITNEMPKYS